MRNTPQNTRLAKYTPRSFPLALISLIWVSGLASPSSADPLSVCLQANPDFPQLCPCAVEQAKEAGFQEPKLSALLGHNYMTATPQEVQSFGLIFVQCTQAAVTGSFQALALPELGAHEDHDTSSTSEAYPTEATSVPTEASPESVLDDAGKQTFPTNELNIAGSDEGSGSLEATLPAIVGTEINLDPTPQPSLGAIDDIAEEKPAASETVPVINLDPTPTAQNAAPTGAINLDPTPIPATPNTEALTSQTTATTTVIDLDPGRASSKGSSASSGATQLIDLDPARPTATEPKPGSGYEFTFSSNAPKRVDVWTPFVGLKTSPPWAPWGPQIAGGGAIFKQDGSFLLAGCNDAFIPTLVLGPVSGNQQYSSGRLLVRGAGGILFETPARPARIEGELLHFSLRGEVLSTLRRGSSVEIEITPREGGTSTKFTFGLKGSSKALETTGWRNCVGARSANARPGSGSELINGKWLQRFEKDRDGKAGPMARFEHYGAFEIPMLRCDRRLRIDRLQLWYVEPGTAPAFEAAPNYQLQVDDNPPHNLNFVRDDPNVETALTRAPLPDSLIAELEYGRALSISPLLNEPGYGTARAFELTGLTPLLDKLTCPENAPRPATARIDLTAEAYLWTAEDLAPYFYPGATNPEPVLTASLSFPSGATADIPAFSLDCTGVPFFWENFGVSSSSFDVVMVMDGDEAARVVIEYGNWRNIFNPGIVPPDLGQRVLSSTTLRLTSVGNPELDVLYPMSGAYEALKSAGCGS